jgi:hypothetical protein
MHLSTLHRRLARIEQCRSIAASRCDLCGGGDTPAGIRFVYHPELPPPAQPCARCGRVREPLTFVIRPAVDPRLSEHADSA